MRAIADSCWVGLGAALGANLRYWISYFARAPIASFPWPTLLVNVLGSALLGAFSAVALQRGWGGHWRLFFAVGVCGGFTTFSTFSYEVLFVGFERSWKLATLYAALSFVLSVGACLAAGHVARLWVQAPAAARIR